MSKAFRVDRSKVLFGQQRSNKHNAQSVAVAAEECFSTEVDFRVVLIESGKKRKNHRK